MNLGEKLRKFYSWLTGANQISHAVAQSTVAFRQEMAQSNVALRQEMAQSNVALRQEMADSTVRIREDVGKFVAQLSLLQGELDQFRRFVQYTRSLRTPDVGYERIEPGDPEQRIAFMRHLAAYRHAYQWVRTGYRVLDLGCGEGYGAYLLSGRAAEVVGYDISAETIAAASGKYSRFAGHLSFKTYDGAHVPEEDRSCDLVACLQVIEHVRDPESFLVEVKRILKPQGVLVISTPNRLTFSPDGKVHIHHVREFSPEEFRSLLEMQFSMSDLLGLHCSLVVTLREDVGGTEYGRRGKKIRDAVSSLPPDIQRDVWTILMEASAVFSVDLADTGHFFLHDQNLDEAVDLISLCRPKAG